MVDKNQPTTGKNKKYHSIQKTPKNSSKSEKIQSKIPDFRYAIRDLKILTNPQMNENFHF